MRVGCFSPALGGEDNCGGMEGEWDKGVRKGEKEIRVTVSKSGRDMRDVQSLHPCRVMSADTQNCFNAWNKSHFCATSNLFQMIEETKTSI